MKRKATLLFLVTFVLLLGAVAQEKLKTVIEPLQNERWWGGFVALGNQMPFNDPNAEFFRLCKLERHAGRSLRFAVRYCSFRDYLSCYFFNEAWA